MTKTITFVFAVLFVAGSLAIPGAPTSGAPILAGHRGLSFGLTQSPFGDPNNGPSSAKPQSKLWFNDGRWWAVLFNRTAGAYHIYHLDQASQTWHDSGVVVDQRFFSHADALWDGRYLYVASASQPGSGNPDTSALMLRYSYHPLTRTYSLDEGFPITVANVSSEAIVMEKDSGGTLWVTYTARNATGGRNVYLTHSLDGDLSWAAPFVLPAGGANNLTLDDISAVVAFGQRIGVMWSNQNDAAIYFASHADGTPDNLWQRSLALRGRDFADDHINLKSLRGDDAGRVFATVKTAQDERPSPDPKAPLVLLLVLDEHGTWRRHTVGTVADALTRPIVAIDNQNRDLYVFATTNNATPPSGIYYKRSSLAKIGFVGGQGTPFVQSDADRNINNATSTRRPVNGRTDLVVLASDLTTGNYWHNTLTLPDEQRRGSWQDE